MLRIQMQRSRCEGYHTLSALLSITQPLIICIIALWHPIIPILLPLLLLLLLCQKPLWLRTILVLLLLNQLVKRQGLVARIPLCLPWQKVLATQTRQTRPEVLVLQAVIGVLDLPKPDEGPVAWQGVLIRGAS
jgi:hypothetical protein